MGSSSPYDFVKFKDLPSEHALVCLSTRRVLTLLQFTIPIKTQELKCVMSDFGFGWWAVCSLSDVFVEDSCGEL